jgi:hypothetical protein
MAIDNPFGNTYDGTGQPALRVENITTNDSADQPSVYRMIYVGVGGDIKITDMVGNVVVHKNAAAGSYIGPFRCARVWTTGTTATNLLGYV